MGYALAGDKLIFKLDRPDVPACLPAPPPYVFGLGDIAVEAGSPPFQTNKQHVRESNDIVRQSCKLGMKKEKEQIRGRRIDEARGGMGANLEDVGREGGVVRGGVRNRALLPLSVLLEYLQILGSNESRVSDIVPRANM